MKVIEILNFSQGRSWKNQGILSLSYSGNPGYCSVTNVWCTLVCQYSINLLFCLDAICHFSWDGHTFVEVVKADFVLFEEYGMHNYRYLQTAKKAKCVSQPQNWISLMASQTFPDIFSAWTRKVIHNIVEQRYY